MPALYPSQSAPEDFQVGDCVRKWVTEWNVTPFIGVVTHIVPATFKVWVQWPLGSSPEDPETLVKVNPEISGMPTVHLDSGYDSYEKQQSEGHCGKIPHRITPSRDLTKPIPMMALTASNKMAIRIAHTFATNVIGKLVDDIVRYKNQKLSDVQTYNRVYEKYAAVCSDYIMRSSIGRIYSGESL